MIRSFIMWNCIKSVVRGRSHFLENTPCQDKVFSLNKSDCIVISLADGAGSAKFSHLGAESITRHICTILDVNFFSYFNSDDGANVKKQILDDTIKCLKNVSQQQNCELRDLASTLLAVAIKGESFILLHIGDGVIGFFNKGELKVASAPVNGEFVNTTVFTTSETALASMKLIKGSLKNIDGFVLMSDGCENSFYNKKENKLSLALKRVMSLMSMIYLDKLEAQLDNSMESIIAKKTMDDCSIIMISRNSFEGYKKLSYTDRCKILQIDKMKYKQFNRLNEILFFLQSEKKLSDISKHIHLKPKFTKRKYIDKLLKLNFIEQNNACYYKSILRME